MPILKNTITLIDIVLIQAYNNWYDSLTEGSLNYFQDIYLNWINQPSPFCSGCSIIANFTGVPMNKVVIGFPASTSAGNTPPTPQVIDQFQTWIGTSNFTIGGYFLWDSHWDSLNSYSLSNTILTASTNTPLTPNPPAPSPLCPPSLTT